MLTIYRRHVKTCKHKADGRKYRRCRCPIWVDGFLNGDEVRESLDLHDWEKAQERIRDWEAEGGRVPAEPEQQAISLENACAAFISDAKSRELQESTLRKYRQLTKQMQAFSAAEGLRYLKEWEDLELVRRFRQTWQDKGNTVVKKMERLRAFFRFAVDSEWIVKNPAAKMKSPYVKPTPTLPFTQEEMVSILAACDRHQGNKKRIRALVLLLRYSGLRIGDAVRLARDRIVDGRLFLYTQKTGVPVLCPLPDFVSTALDSFTPMNNTYYFWSGESSRDGVARTYMGRLAKIFKLADVKGGHAHRFRDTFATELLLAGVPLERVSVLLGHSSVKVTEKHYSPWVRARQEQLEADVKATWGRDPMVLAETKGTPEVHGIRDIVN
jgi:integrase